MSITDALTDIRMALERTREAMAVFDDGPSCIREDLVDAATHLYEAQRALTLADFHARRGRPG